MRRAPTVASTMPPSSKPDSGSLIMNPPTATIRPTAAVYWLTGREKSTRVSTPILSPMTPIRAYRPGGMPPSTPAGTELMTAPNLGEMVGRMAGRPAAPYAAGE